MVETRIAQGRHLQRIFLALIACGVLFLTAPMNTVWADDDSSSEWSQSSDDSSSDDDSSSGQSWGEVTNTPEMDPTTATSALAILVCGLLILTSRKARTA